MGLMGRCSNYFPTTVQWNCAGCVDEINGAIRKFIAPFFLWYVHGLLRAQMSVGVL